MKYIYKHKRTEQTDASRRYRRFIESKSETARDRYFEKKIARRLEIDKTKKRIMCVRVVGKFASKSRNDHVFRSKKGTETKSSVQYREYVSRMCPLRVVIHYELKLCQKRLSSFVKRLDKNSIVPIHEVDLTRERVLNEQVDNQKAKRLQHDRTCKCFCK